MIKQAGTQYRISIPYHPYKFDEGGHAYTKSAEDGIKHRYLAGIISGPQKDGQDEKVTSNCIKSFQEQANSGDILLYDERHGEFSFSDDIGILTKHEIQPNGDWYGEFRLYDNTDKIDANTAARIDKLWKQVNGLPPYTKKKQKGFSIEGFVPADKDILHISPEGKRTIDNITLQGVIITPNPAYTSSVAGAFYKALGETVPEISDKVTRSFKSIISDQEITNAYYKKHYIYQDALDDVIEDIMMHEGIKNKKEELNKVFDEYKTSMIELILQSVSIFKKSENSKKEDAGYLYTPPSEKLEILKSMLSTTNALITKIQGEL